MGFLCIFMILMMALSNIHASRHIFPGMAHFSSSGLRALRAMSRTLFTPEKNSRIMTTER